MNNTVSFSQPDKVHQAFKGIIQTAQAIVNEYDSNSTWENQVDQENRDLIQSEYHFSQEILGLVAKYGTKIKELALS